MEKFRQAPSLQFVSAKSLHYHSSFIVIIPQTPQPPKRTDHRLRHPRQQHRARRHEILHRAAQHALALQCTPDALRILGPGDAVAADGGEAGVDLGALLDALAEGGAVKADGDGAAVGAVALDLVDFVGGGDEEGVVDGGAAAAVG